MKDYFLSKKLMNEMNGGTVGGRFVASACD